MFFFFFNDTATTEIYTLSLHDALPIYGTGSAYFEAGYHYYAVTRSGTTVIFYKDGTAFASAGTPTTSNNWFGGFDFSIGTRTEGSAAESWKGGIGECAVWNSALTAHEVEQLHSGVRRMPLQIDPANLLLYAILDDNPEETGIGGDTYTDLVSRIVMTGVDADGNSLNTSDRSLSYP